ncbi:peptidase [Mycobacterium sp. NPDC050551]|uniref:peptidase n=1 Tax=Mycobacterium sp. NPDC050551 TaxID=3155407 RepID=UPI0034334E24
MCALLLLDRSATPTAPQTAAPAPAAPASVPAATSLALTGGRTATLIAVGSDRSAALTRRIADELGPAADAVTAFWGPDWRRDIVVAVASSDAQFAALAAPTPGAPTTDIAAVTTADRILFAPGAAAMTTPALRIVLRHELFHYAARADTAADAPRWLTEGVADYVARPAPAPPPGAGMPARLPTDADLDTAGTVRSLAYDRAWLFSRYVADSHGTAALRALYLRACGPGHPDVATAVRDTLGLDLPEVEAGWRAWQGQ